MKARKLIRGLWRELNQRSFSHEWTDQTDTIVKRGENFFHKVQFVRFQSAPTLTWEEFQRGPVLPSYRPRANDRGVGKKREAKRQLKSVAKSRR